MHWRRKWQPTPVFLPGESQGRGNLVGCRPWGHTESDTRSNLAAAAAVLTMGSSWWLVGKEFTCSARQLGSIPGGEDPLEEGMATHSYSSLGNPMDRGAWWAIVHEVTRVGHHLATEPPPSSVLTTGPP